MSMSMYEKMMSLPLLRGAGVDFITAFIEKTDLDFTIYESGDTIVSPGDVCRSLISVISGSAEIEHSLFGNNLQVLEQVGEGCHIGAERLFGMDNTLNFSVRALERCGTVEIGKVQYLQLLRTDNIFLINSLNYLSRRSQKYDDAIARVRSVNVANLLAMIVDTTTMRQAHGITLRSVSLPIIDLLGSLANVNDGSMENLLENGLVSMLTDKVLAVNDRNRLVESVLDS